MYSSQTEWTNHIRLSVALLWFWHDSLFCHRRPLFSPCKCSGSIGLVHQDCLTSWLAVTRGEGRTWSGCFLFFVHTRMSSGLLAHLDLFLYCVCRANEQAAVSFAKSNSILPLSTQKMPLINCPWPKSFWAFRAEQWLDGSHFSCGWHSVCPFGWSLPHWWRPTFTSYGWIDLWRLSWNDGTGNCSLRTLWAEPFWQALFWSAF